MYDTVEILALPKALVIFQCLYLFTGLNDRFGYNAYIKPASPVSFYIVINICSYRSRFISTFPCCEECSTLIMSLCVVGCGWKKFAGLGTLPHIVVKVRLILVTFIKVKSWYSASTWKFWRGVGNVIRSTDFIDRSTVEFSDSVKTPCFFSYTCVSKAACLPSEQYCIFNSYIIIRFNRTYLFESSYRNGKVYYRNATANCERHICLGFFTQRESRPDSVLPKCRSTHFRRIKSSK